MVRPPLKRGTILRFCAIGRNAGLRFADGAST
jgi:hypothetical protein